MVSLSGATAPCILTTTRGVARCPGCSLPMPFRNSDPPYETGMEHDPVGWPQQIDAVDQLPTSARRLRIVPPSDDAVAPDTLLPRTVSDDELIAALVAGEVAALAALYERHAHLVFAMLVRIVRDRAAAEDLLQEAFLRAWLHAHVFDEGRGTVRGWLHSIAHNLALNELRRQRRRPHASRRATPDDADEEDAGLGAAAGDPAVDAWCAIRDDGLADVLARLPPAQRDVLTLYAAGFSQSEIAAELDQPLGTVKSRMRRALCFLREVLPTVGIDAGWRAD